MEIDLNAIKERARAAATEHPEPWWWGEPDTASMRLFDGSEQQKQILKAPRKSVEFACYWPPKATAEFIAHSLSDVLALLEYLDSYEMALKPLRGKTFTYVPGLEMLNTVTGPSKDDLLVRIAELEAEVENLQRAYNAEMRESMRRR